MTPFPLMPNGRGRYHWLVILLAVLVLAAVVGVVLAILVIFQFLIKCF